MTDLENLLMDVAHLYDETGVLINWFPFKMADGTVRFRIYSTDTRNWKVNNPIVDGAYPHFGTLEEAITNTLAQYIPPPTP